MTDSTRIVLRDAEFLLYQTEDGRTRIEVRFDGDTAWLSLGQLATLFHRDKSVISRHIKNVFDEGELTPEATVAKSATVQREGEREVTREVEYYNLDVIISVGYRVKSRRGTQFRMWATERLREYIVKGFTLDDDRLKRAGGGELLRRAPRADPRHPLGGEGLLAKGPRDLRDEHRLRPELRGVATLLRDPAEQDALGRPRPHRRRSDRRAGRRCEAKHGPATWAGESPRKADVAVAKNYLAEGELEALNRIVNAYLEFAELQAMNRKPMYMADWIAKLDDFLRISEREILRHAGKVSHETAVAKAELEYDRFAAERAALPSPAEKHFEEAIRDVKQLAKKRPPARKGTKRR